MIRKFFISIFALTIGVSSLLAQSYEQLWKSLNQYEKEGRPQSAISIAQQIFTKAQAERLVPQMMRAYLTAMGHRKHLSIDSFYVDIAGLEAWTDNPSTSVNDAAILHSLLGSIYMHSAQGRYDNKVVQELPKDMSQWTQLMYYQRSFDHFMASVNRLEELCKYTTHDYAPITYFGRWSNYYQHDLMHFVGRRAVFGIRDLEGRLSRSYKQTGWNTFALDYAQFSQDSLVAVSPYDCPAQVMRIFQQMLALLEKDKQPEGWIFMELNRMNIIPEYQRDNAEHIRLLYAMKERYRKSKLCGGICFDIASIYNREERYTEALAVLREGIKKYPQYEAVNALRNLEKEILQPHFNMNNLDDGFYPGDTVGLQINYRNLNKFTVRLRRVKCSLDTLYKYRGNAQRLRKFSKYYSEREYHLLSNKDYQPCDTVIQMPVPKAAGVYLIEAIAGGEGSNLSMFYTSPYKLIETELPGGTLEYTVLDKKSGHPIPRAMLHIATYDAGKKNKLVKKESLQTNEQGSAILLSGMNGNLIRVTTRTDDTMPYVYRSTYSSSRRNDERLRLVTRLMSDRTHFRPGQTIYIKGINYWQHPNDSVWAAKEEVFELMLKDPKNQLIETKKVKSNEFGSFFTEFLLPTDGLNGIYRVETYGGNTREGSSLTFHVEEYKLPTFEVTFDNVKVAYAIGDTVTLTGQALGYNGVPVAESKVRYEILKTYHGWLRGWRDSRFDKDITTGETVTAEDGRFSIDVYLDEDANLDELCWWRYQYSVMATITSAAGESQEARTHLELGSTPLKMNVVHQGEHWLKGKPHPLTFRVTNLSGETIKTNVHYQIYQITNPRIMEGNKDNQRRLVYQGWQVANEPMTLALLDKLPSAYYEIVATTALDGQKDSVRCAENFALYDEHETKVPLGDIHWFNWLEDEVAVGEPACLQFGTRKQDVYVMMDVFCEQKRIENHRFYMSDTVQTFTFEYLPKYGKGLYVRVLYTKDGETYHFEKVLNKKLPEKQLEVKWETFRNRLITGSQEEWTLTVCHPNGAPANAELLASMHDASLDRLGRQRDWTFGLHFPRLGYWRFHWRNLTGIYINNSIYYKLSRKEIPAYCRYDDIVERYYNFGLPFLRSGEEALSESYMMVGGMRRGVSLAAKMVATNQTTSGGGRDVMMVEEDAEIEAAMMNFDGSVDEGGEQETEASPETLPEDMLLRENFTETAFFQPGLRTDSLGRVKVSFTLPDNLTRWHFRALAHTKQMEYGTLEDFVTAAREFMVQPNLPRFVRVGDETTIKATISNLSEKNIKGTARMELIDPMTERVLLSRKVKFYTEAGKTATVTFPFTVKNTDVSLPICRIVADGGKFSDGEQRYLPVLTNKVWVTESQPLVINGAGIVTEKLNHLFNHHSRTASNHRLTVELTGNPAWMAIQALPTVATPTTEDAFSWATAWYAHSMASHIAQSQPKIKAVFDSWQAQEESKETLWSNLQKNEDLKTLMLAETPWMAEAADEASQKRQLALLFDGAKAKSRIRHYLDKLQALQGDDGGWSWYKGMSSSRQVTTYILELMERIAYVTGNEQDYDTRHMMALATEYLNQKLVEEYHNMLKLEKEGKKPCPSELALHYLGSLALNGKKLDRTIQKVADHMVAHLPEQLNALTPYGKAKASIILHHYGRQVEALQFVASLKEYTTYTPQMGRFFDNPSFVFGWRNQRIPTQTAAIEAFSFIGRDSLSVEQMKQWLLMQKQTQRWESPLSTVDAIHALLMQGTDLLATDSNTILKLDGKRVETTERPTTAIDYLKRSYTTQELKRLPRKASIEKNGNGIAWGAVYAQYLEDMDKATSTYTGRTDTPHGQMLTQPLSIERTWMVQRIVDGQKRWMPLDNETTLNVGDKVLSQLVIRADRAMDFVQVKDCRAACTEPTSSASGYRYNGSFGFYCSVTDAATYYFIDHLPKGTYTLEQTFHIDRVGRYQAGLATVQCTYASEFVGHTEGNLFTVQ